MVHVYFEFKLNLGNKLLGPCHSVLSGGAVPLNEVWGFGFWV